MPVAGPAKSKKPLIIGITAAVVLIGGFLLLRSGSDVPAVTPGIVVGDTNNIVVNDQDADSVSVLVASASLRATGYVIIHEDNGGLPGAIIGIGQLLQPGTYKNISVISNKLRPGVTYIAMLHGDDGNGIFNEANDKPLNDNAGNAVMVEFKVKLTTNGESKG